MFEYQHPDASGHFGRYGGSFASETLTHALIELRDTVDPADPESAALAELFFTAFYVNYATDLKIGRLTPQKVDPKNYRNRKTVDVLAIMTGFSAQPEPDDFLDAFKHV